MTKNIEEINRSYEKALQEIIILLDDRVISRVSKNTNVSRATIHNIRSGKNTKPTMTTLRKLAEYLRAEK